MKETKPVPSLSNGGEHIISITPVSIPVRLAVNFFGRGNGKAEIEVLAIVKYYFAVWLCSSLSKETEILSFFFFHYFSVYDCWRLVGIGIILWLLCSADSLVDFIFFHCPYMQDLCREWGIYYIYLFCSGAVAILMWIFQVKILFRLFSLSLQLPKADKNRFYFTWLKWVSFPKEMHTLE